MRSARPDAVAATIDLLRCSSDACSSAFKSARHRADMSEATRRIDVQAGMGRSRPCPGKKSLQIMRTTGTASPSSAGIASRLNRWLDPWVMIFLNLPALVVIVLCYLWIGLNEVAAIAAVTLNKTAMVLVTMREGARAL